MRTVIYSMSVSLDGFIAGQDGDIELGLLQARTSGSRVVYLRYWHG